MALISMNIGKPTIKEHYYNQKINGLTFPCTICSSAFTQKLDIEGCDPLALPLAALLLSTSQQPLAKEASTWNGNVFNP